MYILAIETTGAFASVALMKDDKIIGHITGSDRFSHLQNLMPQVDAVIKECKLSIGDINAIAVSCGPGSFTGIRIGVSSARALSQALDIPCVPVSGLEALAMRGTEWGSHKEANESSLKAANEGSLEATYDGSRKAAEGDSGEELLICPMLDARRSQVYAGGYFLKDGYPTEVIPAGPYMLEEFMENIGENIDENNRILVLGDAIDKYEEKIREFRPKNAHFAPESIRYQDAAFVARLGRRAFQEKGGCAYYQLKPEYMRLAEAERRLEEKMQEINAKK